jgi:hypothetical protein
MAPDIDTASRTGCLRARSHACGKPAAFPRDAPLIRTQGQFFVVDEVLALIGRATGASMESRFFAAYLVPSRWCG